MFVLVFVFACCFSPARGTCSYIGAGGRQTDEGRKGKKGKNGEKNEKKGGKKEK